MATTTCISTVSKSPIAHRLTGKVALITGGASGIGEATARLFAQNGAKVIIADIQDDIGHSVCETIPTQDPKNTSFVHCDVTKDSDVENAIKFVITKYGKLDIMFNNAAIPGNFDRSILNIEYQDFKKVFDVNVYGAFLGAKYAAQAMIPAKKGSILFASSIAAVYHGDTAHPYTASKHAVVGLTKNLSVELGMYGIRVNCISPFGVVTPMLTSAMGGVDKEVIEDLFCKSANLKEVKLEAEDIAEAALYLGSDASKYVSGINLIVDGGFSNTNTALRDNITKLFG